MMLSDHQRSLRRRRIEHTFGKCLAGWRQIHSQQKLDLVLRSAATKNKQYQFGRTLTLDTRVLTPSAVL
jgi:hypothetical protein